MSGRAARTSEAPSPRVLVLHDGAPHDVFDVLAMSDDVIQVRAAFLFEVGEELSVRIERGGRTSEVTARVRAHAGPPDARVTELAIDDPAGQGG
jgi:hypothetical protein